MGQYSVPEVIRKHKPKGTMVKLISGHYYVYKYSNYTDSQGKRHTKMGELVGSIKPGTGFIPNSNLIRTSAISSLDFGEYAVTMADFGSDRLLNREIIYSIWREEIRHTAKRSLKR